MFEFTQSPRIKRSPFHDAIVEEGVKSFYPYNNMFLPTGYGNPDEDKKVHYPIFSCGYIKGATRLMASYGRQRAGLFCVGGVCRFVPASNGLTLSFTQSF